MQGIVRHRQMLPIVSVLFCCWPNKTWQWLPLVYQKLRADEQSTMILVLPSVRRSIRRSNRWLIYRKVQVIYPVSVKLHCFRAITLMVDHNNNKAFLFIHHGGMASYIVKISRARLFWVCGKIIQFFIQMPCIYFRFNITVNIDWWKILYIFLGRF
jgi:hypothetical protein